MILFAPICLTFSAGAAKKVGELSAYRRNASSRMDLTTMLTATRTDSPLYRYRFGAVEFDEARLELRVGGLIVELEQKPLQVLAELLKRADEVVTREELFGAVWGGVTVGDHALTNALAKLRRALGDDEKTLIVNVSRVGYRLVGPVDRTAVGRRLVSRLELVAGAAVPGRDHFVLDQPLAVSNAHEVWLARHAKTKEPRVFKFSVDGERLGALKREVTLSRVLQESLGDRGNIARIIDWNFQTPPFFIECEYGGQNLLQWADTDGRLAALPRDQRLALFLQIAEAVADAHSVGVLHKDLKPSNILIKPRDGGGWQARVADFGSGRLVEPSRLEELGISGLDPADAQRESMGLGAGTPYYIAPEVVAGQISTVQSDVYALGLILYQLVIGDLKRPMASGWEHAVGDDLLVADIAAAGDGNPARRLASVVELVNRLRTLDARRTAQALARAARLRTEVAERAGERARARRPWIIAAVVGLALGFAASLASYWGEREARRDAERERARAEEINRFLSEDLLGAADPSGPGGAHNPTMREVLAATDARLDSRRQIDPETKASIDAALGNAYFGMTDYADAEKHVRRAFELLTAARGADSSATLEAEYRLISLLTQSGRLDEAQHMLDAADRRAGTRLTELSQLAFQAHWTRGNYYKLRMLPDKALAEYSAAERVRAATEPANDTTMFRLRDALSWCYVRLERNEEAERVLRDVVTPAYPPERVGPLIWAQVRTDYGLALETIGKTAEAESVMSDALRELRETLGKDHFFVAVVQNELSDLYGRQGRWREARESLSEAHAIWFCAPESTIRRL